MIYVCGQKRENGNIIYALKSTGNGKVAYGTKEALDKYVANGTKVIGYTDLGIFSLNEKQLESFETYIKLLNKYNEDFNKNKQYRLGKTLGGFEKEYEHSMCFREDYRGGFGGGSTSIIFNLSSDGNILNYSKYYLSALAANVSGYNGNYSGYVVLYFGEKPDYKYQLGDDIKYYKRFDAFYKGLKR